MKQLLLVVVLAFASIAPKISVASEAEQLFESFDPKIYTRDELRFIQLGLAFEGYYQGLLDGAWGKISSKALTRFAHEIFESEPLHIHAAFLALETVQVAVEDDWRYQYFDKLGLSFLIPSKSIVEGEPSDDFLNYEHRSSSLRYSISLGNQKWTQGIHDYAENFHTTSGVPYTVRKQGFAVTSSRNTRGQVLYVRSRYWKGGWSTLLLSADAKDAGLLGAVSSSISNDRYVQLMVPKEGFLVASAKHANALMRELEEEEESARGSSSATTGLSPPSKNEQSTGSGFWVSADGHVLTNAHVVNGCSTLKVNGKISKLVTVSESFDLALIQTEPVKYVAKFATEPAKLNQDVTVVGYPLSFILGGVNVTRGAISSMTGLAGDETTMQISAPVQSGNSGGPVVSTTGEVVGVVVSKLNTQAVQGAFGDTPQNINFAVRGEVAKLFLSLNGVDPQFGHATEKLNPVALAERVTGFTAFIECN